MLQMCRSRNGAVRCQLAIQIGHEFFLFNRMIAFAHDFASPSAALRVLVMVVFRFGSRKFFNAMRERKSRDRTVFTGKPQQLGDLRIVELLVFPQHQDLALTRIQFLQCLPYPHRFF